MMNIVANNVKINTYIEQTLLFRIFPGCILLKIFNLNLSDSVDVADLGHGHQLALLISCPPATVHLKCVIIIFSIVLYHPQFIPLPGSPPGWRTLPTCWHPPAACCPSLRSCTAQ